MTCVIVPVMAALDAVFERIDTEVGAPTVTWLVAKWGTLSSLMRSFCVIFSSVRNPLLCTGGSSRSRQRSVGGSRQKVSNKASSPEIIPLPLTRFPRADGTGVPSSLYEPLHDHRAQSADDVAQWPGERG
jgi:hypothetical protein